MITARNGLKVQPDYSIEDLPPVDILLIPGGKGVRENEVQNDIIINWIRQQMKEVKTNDFSLYWSVITCESRFTGWLKSHNALG